MLVVSGLFVLALLAGVLGGVVGTGSSLLLLPVLISLYGPRTAVPVMGIAAVFGNAGRVFAWWRLIAWRPVVAFAAPGVPAAALGAHTLLTVPPRLVDAFLAVFFCMMIPVRRSAAAGRWSFGDRQMALAGVLVGFLTGLVLSTGPLTVPIFTAYGLGGGAFLGSEAASALVLYAGKLATFGAAGALDGGIIVRGLAIGVALMAGSIVARGLVDRVGPRSHGRLIDAVLATASVAMLVSVLG